VVTAVGLNPWFQQMQGQPCTPGSGMEGRVRKGDPLDSTRTSPRSLSRHPRWSQAAALCYSWGASKLSNTTRRPGSTDHSWEPWLQLAHQPGKKTKHRELVGRTMHAAEGFELRYS